MSISTRRSSLPFIALVIVLATGSLNPVAAQEPATDDGLGDLVESDPTLLVDPNGELRYVDPLAPDEPASEGAEDDEPEIDQGDDDESASPPEFELASLPGATRTILLDFDGHVTTGTSWNVAEGIDSIVTGPYDLDGDPATWSTAELQVVHDTWAVVAEDFAPWNVNVTTKEPSDPADLTNDGDGDARLGARVVITPDDWSECGCGAMAYLGAFHDPNDEPAFVYNTGFRGVSEAASHAIGHLLGLHHDGRTDGDALYGGHESLGGPDWAPIMGSSFGRALGQWSSQEFPGADNTEQDDVAVLSSPGEGTGLGLRPDDHGGPADPTPLNGASPRVDGLIGTRSDTDAFAFTTTGGTVLLAITGVAIGTNLDAGLTLLDADGEVVATDDPIDELSAEIDIEVAAGAYTVVVDGVGVGLPFVDPPTGYSDKASLGRYVLTGTIAGAPPADLDPPATPQGLIGIEVDGTLVFGWAPNDDEDLDGYVVRRSTEPGGPSVDIATLRADRNGHEDPAPPAGQGHYVVVAVDAVGNRSEPSNEVIIAVGIDDDSPADPTPSADPDPDPATVPDPETDDEPEEDSEGETVEETQRETFVYGTVIGDITTIAEADGDGQRITETLSGGASPARHDRLDHRWSIPAATGNQQLRVVAEAADDAGDADEGFVIGWSTDKVEWTALVTILPGEAIDETFDIGAPEEMVHVRVRDTDRTPRQQLPDSVFVDLVQVIGDGRPVEPEPDPTEAVAEVRFHFQGLGEGERAVVVTGSVFDDRGDPVAGATIEVEVGGDITETVTIVTGRDGTGVEQTSGAALRPDVDVCVADLQVDGLARRAGAEDCRPPATVTAPEEPAPGTDTDTDDPLVAEPETEPEAETTPVDEPEPDPEPDPEMVAVLDDEPAVDELPVSEIE